MANRALKLPDTQFQDRAISKAKNALKLNYPQKLINQIFKNRVNKIKNNNPVAETKQKDQKKYLFMPYIKGLSTQFNNLLSKHNITVCHKGHRLLAKNFSKLISKTSKNKTSNIVYEIPCNDCESVYIGQTSQYLENKI